MSSIHVHFDFMTGPLESDRYPTIILESLRIQLPEEVENRLSKEKPIEKQPLKVKCELIKTEEEEEEVEYTAASPLFTWSDEHIRSVKQEQFGALLWPLVLQSYPSQPKGSYLYQTYATYDAFRKSDIAGHPERYPHHSLRDLMILYMEWLLPIVYATHMNMEELMDLKRRILLRKIMTQRGHVWQPEYIVVYLQWSTTCCKRMNRYQKMVQFVKEFF